MNSPVVIEQSNQLLQALVDEGERVLGYVYPHIPLEIVMAHGLTPSVVRTNPAVVGAYEASLQTFSCSLTRNLFSQRTSGSFPLLAGIVFSGNTCDALQNVGDVWRLRFPEDKVLRLTYPVGDAGESSVHFLTKEIEEFSANLEQLSGTAFSDSAFRHAAALLEMIRENLQLLYAARLTNPSLISFNDLSDLVSDFLTAPTSKVLERVKGKRESVFSQLSDDRNTEVQRVKDSILSQNLIGSEFSIEVDGPRIVVAGGMVEPSTIAGLADGVQEVQDTTLVLDLLTYGFKTVFTPPVDTKGDPFGNSARSILGAPGEPTQEGLPKRVAFLKDILRKFSVQGLILCEQSFCDPDEFEAPSLDRAAREVNVQTLKLPLDSEISDRARLEGRIQTFLETLDANQME